MVGRGVLIFKSSAYFGNMNRRGVSTPGASVVTRVMAKKIPMKIN